MTTVAEAQLDSTMRANRLRRGLRLEYATLGWSVVGCWIVLGAALAARSVALAGFGFDSVIEILASLVVVWQLKAINSAREDLAERLIGGAFVLLAIYIGAQSSIVLLTRFHPRTSAVGMAWLALTVVAMLLLARGKGITGRELAIPVLLKESRVTVVDAVLAASVLVGIALNALAGLWWSDPVAGFVIVFYGLREGWSAIRG